MVESSDLLSVDTMVALLVVRMVDELESLGVGATDYGTRVSMWAVESASCEVALTVSDLVL